MSIGKLYKKTKSIDKELQSYIAAEKIIPKHLKEDKNPHIYYLESKANILNLKGIIFRKFGNYSESLSYYFKAQDIFMKLNDTVIIASINFNIGAIYRYKEEYDKSIEYYKKSLEVRKITNDIGGLINSYNVIGIVHRKL
ncbi:MAG: tetratricopeptide repeat protein [Crocinitomicaceae bacterium]|nr:tetratricopeptide repeat protein [Crocinitomicaceae bacterium]